MMVAEAYYSQIPARLKSLNNWVTWRLENRDGKPTKIPFSLNGRPASSTDKSTWHNFAEVAHCVPLATSGAGFCFNGDGTIGIDLDHCFRNDGSIDPLFAPVMEAFAGTYMEKSPSGKGLHIFVSCKEAPYPTGKRKNFPDGRGIEIYSSGRYFTVTGKKFGESSDIVEYPADTIRNACDHILNFGKEARDVEPKHQETVTASKSLSDEEILKIASKAKNGEAFEKLYDGRHSYPSGSEADLALASMLAFYTKDAAQIRRIMYGSGLLREKWEQHPTYLSGTISTAVSSVKAQYTGRAVKDYTKVSNKPEYIYPAVDEETGEVTGWRIDYMKYSDFLFEKFHVHYFNNDLYIFNEDQTVYQTHLNQIETHVRDTCKEYDIPGKLSAIEREIITHLKSMGSVADYPFTGKFGTVNVANGSLDLSTGVLSKTEWSHLYDYRIETDYKQFPDGTPELDAFLSIYKTTEPIDILAKSIWQRAYHDTLKEITVLYGPKDSGKTTVAELVQSTLDGSLHKNKNVSRTLLHDLLQRFGYSSLEGKLLNFGDDLPDMFIKNAGKINEMVGSVVRHIEKKGIDGYDSTVTAYYLFTTNNLPPLDDDDSVIWGKIHLVQFKDKVSLPFCPRETLFTQIIREQLLYRAIERAKEWNIVRYQNNQSPDEVRMRWHEASTDVDTFLIEATEFDPNCSPVSLEDVKKHYANWCVVNCRQRHIKYLQKKIQPFMVRRNMCNGYVIKLLPILKHGSNTTIF